MALGTPAAGTIVASLGNSAAPAYPAGIQASDVLVLIIGLKPATANGGSVTTPSGWTLRESLTGAGGYGSTLGADTGNTSLYAYTKTTVTGSESGTLSVTLGDTNVNWAVIIRIPSGGGTISFGSSDGADSAAGNVSVTCAADPGVTAGDCLIWAMCIPTDVTTPTQFSAHAMSINGITGYGTIAELGEADSTSGNDIGGFIATVPVTAGTSSAAPTFSATAGGTTTNVRGPGVLLRIREVAPASHVYRGSAGWSAAYKGVRSDAALYKGAQALHP